MDSAPPVMWTRNPTAWACTHRRRRRWQVDRDARPLCSRKSAGNQSNRSGLDVALNTRDIIQSPADSTSKTQPWISPHAKVSIKELRAVEKCVAVKPAQPCELSLLHFAVLLWREQSCGRCATCSHVWISLVWQPTIVARACQARCQSLAQLDNGSTSAFAAWGRMVCPPGRSNIGWLDSSQKFRRPSRCSDRLSPTGFIGPNRGVSGPRSAMTSNSVAQMIVHRPGQIDLA